MEHNTQRTISEENNDDFVMVRLRVPRYVYRQLSLTSVQRDMKLGRFIIELLRTVAHKEIEKAKEWEDEPPCA